MLLLQEGKWGLWRPGESIGRFCRADVASAVSSSITQKPLAENVQGWRICEVWLAQRLMHVRRRYNRERMLSVFWPEVFVRLKEAYSITW